MDENNTLHVPRFATIQRDEGNRESRLLAEWRSLDAYVLLGDPGAGKSVSFQQEAAACGTVPVTARDFIAEIEPDKVDGQVIFIDGLDEVRAGQQDGRVPFEAIRRRLKKLGQPRFRLSCREADWLGQSDKSNLAKVAPKQSLEVLHLDPLKRDDVLFLLRARSKEIPDADADAFWQQAERFSLTGMFSNPLLLDLTIKAVSGGGWPKTRRDIYDAACRRLATEFSPEHLLVKTIRPGDIDRLLDDAGLLCAVLLLSNKAMWTSQTGKRVNAAHLPDIPDVLHFHDARAALASNVFTTIAGQSMPRHRSIAEFLGAKALAKKIREGLPLGRVLALMQGFDGRPVESLRGLFAWFAVHHAPSRSQMIYLDPLGIVLNGDTSSLSTPEKIEILDALQALSVQDPWFRQNQWVGYPFGSLATRDLIPKHIQLLSSSKRDDRYQLFISCILDALRHGEQTNELAPILATWITDDRVSIGNRLSAYDAWKHHSRFQSSEALGWLNAIFNDQLQDEEDQLLNALLIDLYPKYLTSEKVFDYLRVATADRRVVSKYPSFWCYSLINQSSPDDYLVLADNWNKARLHSPDGAPDFDMIELSGELLAAVLNYAGDTSADELLYDWLGICLDKYGHSQLDKKHRSNVIAWLEARPHRIKSIVAFGYSNGDPSVPRHRQFLEAEWRIHGAKLPRDWLQWLLELAADTNDEELACYCFQYAASKVIEQSENFELTSMEAIEEWAIVYSRKWPAVNQWLECSWSWPIQTWRSEEYQRKIHQTNQRSESQRQRHDALQKYWQAFFEGNAPPYLTHQLTLAHQGRLSDITGNTEKERIQNYLVSDEINALRAIEGLYKTLSRNDLPTVDEVFDVTKEGRFFYVGPAALLAAEYLFNSDQEIIHKWPDSLLRLLVALHLTGLCEKTPSWYESLLKSFPDKVASVVLHCINSKCPIDGRNISNEIWDIKHEESRRPFAKRILPPLLDPTTGLSTACTVEMINRCLLPAMHLLGETQVTMLIKQNLVFYSSDEEHKIIWLTAALPYLPDAVEQIVSLISRNKNMALLLSEAIAQQDIINRALDQLSPKTIAALIKLIGPISNPGSKYYTDRDPSSDQRENTMNYLINHLAKDKSHSAYEQLKDLSDNHALLHWHTALKYASRTQIIIAREAKFCAAEPYWVASTIANKEPSSPADLREVILQHCSDIELEIKGANTFLVRQYWDVVRKAPYNEEYCRDLLQSQLKERLALLNVYVEREASAANEKRADMRANFMHNGCRIAVPVEVKKDNHPKLWTAWDEQLKRLYTIDPDADGFGIYLVLWFGHKTKSSPSRVKPNSAAQLQNMLTHCIPLEERKRLAVKVMDLSLPAS